MNVLKLKKELASQEKVRILKYKLKNKNMKNTHVLPTDKPSRLGYLTKKGKEVFNDLRLFDRLMPNILDSENQHLYITSDEEITGFENNIWVIKGDRILLWQNMMALGSYNKPKKIILTTDQDLIKDGVQAIDDEFLEWFVKNPSCENVKVELIEEIPSGFTFGMFGNDEPPTELVYKIIIPKEEPKQETLEEVAHKMLVDYGIKSIGQSIGVPTVKKLMVNMAKWQAERMHSEEDLKEAFEAGHKKGFSGYPNTENWKELPFEKWFEQFKKK